MGSGAGKGKGPGASDLSETTLEELLRDELDAGATEAAEDDKPQVPWSKGDVDVRKQRLGMLLEEPESVRPIELSPQEKSALQAKINTCGMSLQKDSQKHVQALIAAAGLEMNKG
mmetsp:Transcript_53323/g.116882  ORF Transcript_53323/g.116882 Transcript_53323/m.116882 type:complete len:115 (+) Transcript_53323:60-404(+)